MWTSKDYSYTLAIKSHKARIEIAAMATKDIDRAIRDMGDKTEASSVEEIRNALGDLEMFLMQAP